MFGFMSLKQWVKECEHQVFLMNEALNLDPTKDQAGSLRFNFAEIDDSFLSESGWILQRCDSQRNWKTVKIFSYHGKKFEKKLILNQLKEMHETAKIISPNDKNDS